MDLLLRLHATNDVAFAPRQEYRIRWDLFTTLELPADWQALAAGSHWPYYALRKADVTHFLRWEVNRWLSAIYTTLTTPPDWPPLDEEGQYGRTAMLSALLSCLRLTTNGGNPSRQSRLAQDRYQRRRAPRAPTVEQAWGALQRPAGRGVISIEEESESGGEGGEGGVGAAARQRRGLALLPSLA